MAGSREERTALLMQRLVGSVLHSDAKDVKLSDRVNQRAYRCARRRFSLQAPDCSGRVACYAAGVMRGYMRGYTRVCILVHPSESTRFYKRMLL
jgi:hypothetical protein